MLDLEKLTVKVREIALSAGAFLRKERALISKELREKKHAHDYVSYVDKEFWRGDWSKSYTNFFLRQVLLLKRVLQTGR